MSHQRQTTVGQYDERPLIEYTADDAPFTRDQLVGSIDVRIAEDRSVRMAAQHRLLGRRDQVGETLLFLALHQGRGLRNRHFQAAGKIDRRLKITAITCDSPDANKS